MNINYLLLAFILAISISCDQNASKKSKIILPDLSPMSRVDQNIGLTLISIEYSRPGMKGRRVFGDLVPYGELWRTGANMRTKFTTSTDLSIEGKDLIKGTYAIFTVPNKDTWDVIFYTEYQASGFSVALDESKVAAKVTVKVLPMDGTMENFSIAFGNFSDGTSTLMYLMWENTKVAIKIDTPTDKIVMESINRNLVKPTADDYFRAAVYYYDSDRDLKKALEWVNKAVEMNPDNFWMTYQKSLIQADLGDENGAITTAKTSVLSAKKAGNEVYVTLINKSIDEWTK